MASGEWRVTCGRERGSGPPIVDTPRYLYEITYPRVRLDHRLQFEDRVLNRTVGSCIFQVGGTNDRHGASLRERDGERERISNQERIWRPHVHPLAFSMVFYIVFYVV